MFFPHDKVAHLVLMVGKHFSKLSPRESSERRQFSIGDKQNNVLNWKPGVWLVCLSGKWTHTLNFK